MGMRRLSSTVSAVSLLTLGGPLPAQLVPEGIHRDTRGPDILCGISGQDAVDLIAKVRAAQTLHEVPTGSDRFEVFDDQEGLLQFAFTRPSEPAHPAVTCRRVYQDETGAWRQTRQMRCDSTRDACDRLFIEFQELDRRVREELSGNR